MKTYEEIVNVVRRCSYPGFEFEVNSFDRRSATEALNTIWVRVRFETECNRTGEPLVQYGRKFHLSPYMVDGEIVQTCWLATQLAIEHEARELFKVDGVAIFNPHIALDSLLSAAPQTEMRK